MQLNKEKKNFSLKIKRSNFIQRLIGEKEKDVEGTSH